MDSEPLVAFEFQCEQEAGLETVEATPVKKQPLRVLRATLQESVACEEPSAAGQGTLNCAFASGYIRWARNPHSTPRCPRSGIRSWWGFQQASSMYEDQRVALG